MGKSQPLKYLYWEDARAMGQSLDQPNFGNPRSWNRWHEMAWRHIDHASLNHWQTDLDLVRVKVRVLVLYAIGFEFCEWLEPGSMSEIEWGYEVQRIGVPPSIVLALAGELPQFGPFCAAVDADFDLSGDLADAELDAETIRPDDLIDLVSGFLCTTYRPAIIRALLKGFGGHAQLFASLWATSRDLGNDMGCMEDELEREREELMQELQDESDWQRKSAIMESIAEIDMKVQKPNLEVTAWNNAYMSAIRDMDAGTDAHDAQDWIFRGCPAGTDPDIRLDWPELGGSSAPDASPPDDPDRDRPDATVGQ